MAEDSKSGPLEGIRVLDMSTMMAGPYGATLLGDLGADVIKIESHYGDESRHLGPERDGEKSAFLSLNRNKRAIVLDLRRAPAHQAFARLVAHRLSPSSGYGIAPLALNSPISSHE